MDDLHSLVTYVLHFLSHEEAAAIVETYSCLDGVDEDNVVRIPVLVAVFVVCGCVCSMIIRSHMSAAANK
jgi:hypothetical protein